MKENYHKAHSYDPSKLKEGRIDEEISYKYNKNKQMMKKLSSSAKSYQKISRSYFDIKTNIISLTEVLQSELFPGLCGSSAKYMIQNICLTNSSLADHFYNLYNMYSELIKQKYERYEEEKSSYKHYVKKVDSLSRDKVGEKDKYIRNKEKLKSARQQYESTGIQFNNFLSKVNKQIQKIWQKNFTNFVTVFVAKFGQAFKTAKQILETNHKLNQSDQIILDEDDIDMNKSRISNKENINLQHISGQIQKFLVKHKDGSQKPLLTDLFRLHENNRTNTNFNSNLNNKQLINNKDKLFGVKNMTIQPNLYIKVDGSQIVKRKPSVGLTPKNDFAEFDNLFSEGQKIQPLSLRAGKSPTKVSPPTPTSAYERMRRKSSNTNFQDFFPPLPAPKTNNQNNINLLDL